MIDKYPQWLACMLEYRRLCCIIFEQNLLNFLQMYILFVLALHSLFNSIGNLLEIFVVLLLIF